MRAPVHKAGRFRSPRRIDSPLDDETGASRPASRLARHSTGRSASGLFRDTEEVAAISSPGSASARRTCGYRAYRRLGIAMVPPPPRWFGGAHRAYGQVEPRQFWPPQRRRGGETVILDASPIIDGYRSKPVSRPARPYDDHPPHDARSAQFRARSPTGWRGRSFRARAVRPTSGSSVGYKNASGPSEECWHARSGSPAEPGWS